MKAWSSAAFNSTYLPALILALGTGIAVPSIPAIARSFHVDFAVATGVTTSFLIGNVSGALPAGWLIDRFGRRRVMLAGPILTAIMAFAVIIAHTYAELLLFRFADGFATQLWMMGRMAGISHGSAADQRGRQVSWMFAMDNAGRALGPLIGGFAAATWGIRSPFVAYGLFALVALVPAYRYLGDTSKRTKTNEPVTNGAISPPPVPPMTYRSIVRSRWSYFLIALFGAFSRGPMAASLMYLYAAFRYHMGPADIGYLAAGAAGIMLPIGFLTGWMMDRFGRKSTMIPGYTGVFLAMVCLAFTAFFNLSVTAFVIVFLVGCVCQGATNGAVQTLGADVAPPEARGKFFGLWRLAGQSGVALSPLIFAALAGAVNYGASFIFVGASAATVALLVASKVPETQPRAALSPTSEPLQASPTEPVHNFAETGGDSRGSKYPKRPAES